MPKKDKYGEESQIPVECLV